ncbi:hypothetical protein ISS05_04120, partial [Candidatus Woesearchaeota archaeon]|nr:hypothetical protein [Candidatus Woesearchaeota archaeon]
LISFPPERLEADIYHGSIFVYELLKNDVPERILPSLLDVSGSKKSIPEKRYFINEIISRGILEYHQTHRHD